jgi:hypothetical protein
MRAKPVVSVVFFLSSYAPLAPIIIFKDYDLGAGRLKHPTGVWIVSALALLSIVVLFLAMRSVSHGIDVRVQSVSHKSGELVNYTIPYMISFFAFDLGNWNDIFAFVFFLSLMYVLTLRTQNIFINPLLALWGWSLYDVTFLDVRTERQGTFLARVELHSADIAVVQRVARFFYIVTSTKEAHHETQPALRRVESS